MNNPMQLDHIALHVTDLKRSIRFYQEILHMQVNGPVHLGTLSKGGRFIGKVAGGQGFLQGIIGSISSRALRDQYTDLAFLSPSGKAYEILLVQERYPETNATRSVDGNTIFGFSCLLSSAVDPEILAWDLNQAGADFTWGDPGLDGTIFSQDCPNHSLYVRDPDGRMIELIPNGVDDPSVPFIGGLNTITLHVTCPDKSKQFYSDKLGMKTESENTGSIPGKRFVRLQNDEGKSCIILFGQTKPDGEPIEAGGYGLDHFAVSGCKFTGDITNDPTDIRMEPEKLTEHTGSAYIRDYDGYWIECMKQ